MLVVIFFSLHQTLACHFLSYFLFYLSSSPSSSPSSCPLIISFPFSHFPSSSPSAHFTPHCFFKSFSNPPFHPLPPGREVLAFFFTLFSPFLPLLSLCHLSPSPLFFSSTTPLITSSLPFLSPLFLPPYHLLFFLYLSCIIPSSSHLLSLLLLLPLSASRLLSRRRVPSAPRRSRGARPSRAP